jgi:hypothetical protein
VTGICALGVKRTLWKVGPSKAERNTYPSSPRPGWKRAKASLEPLSKNQHQEGKEYNSTPKYTPLTFPR